MDQFSNVTQQIEALRKSLHDLLQNKSNADTEIVNASATLDVQLEEYAQALKEKSQPTIRTF